MQAAIHNIAPFNASIGTTVTFTWNGNQIYKVRCIIKENDSGTTVYNGVIDTMKPAFPIPADAKLSNGNYYICYITVFDINQSESARQDTGTPFYCYSTPVFQLSVKEHDVIRASSYEAFLIYSQAQREELNAYCITLYSYQKTKLQSSGNIYDTSGPLSYLISAMENATDYYLRATGETIHGMHLDTGYIPFTVAYTQAQVFNVLEVNNRAEIGGIELRANITSTLGTSDQDVIYLDGEKADLRDNTVTFDVGYEIDGDFSKILKFYKPVLNRCFLTLSDSGDGTQIECYYREGSFSDSKGKMAVIELQASSIFGLHYVLYSNYFPIPDEASCICCGLTRIGNFFDIKVILK